MNLSLPTENGVWQRAAWIRGVCRAIKRREKQLSVTLKCSDCIPSPRVRGSDFEQVPSAYRSGDQPERRQRVDASTTTGIAEFMPWREVGWIFRDGCCIAIERRGPLNRARELVD